jgi:lipopolysaccharide transport system ATP-binding protein
MAYPIVVEGLGKRFRRYHPDRPWTLQEAFLRGFRRLGPSETFWALRAINFRVTRGHMVGVIGANGAGKSTLLRLLGGVGRPDAGRIAVHGRLSALLDLGAGFHHDLTGRENVYVNGVIAGLSRRDVTRRFDDIVAFAEVEKFIDNPLHTYSTGMQMRLAFAIAVHVEPEILLIDEVLSVGDLAFERKCSERIAQFKAQGCTIMLVSHDIASIAELCDEALWLRHGCLVAHDTPEVVIQQYVTAVDIEPRQPVLPGSHPSRLD